MDCIFKGSKEEENKAKMSIDITLKLDQSRKRLEETRQAIRYYEWQSQRAVAEVARIERMAQNGELAIDEYDALMGSHTGGMSIAQLMKSYENLIAENKRLEEETLSEIELLEKMMNRHDEVEKLPGKPYIIFLVSLVIFSAGTILLSLAGKTGQITVGYAVYDPNVIFSGITLVALLVIAAIIFIPLVAGLLAGKLEIFKNKPR